MVNEEIRITDIEYCENYKKIFFIHIVYDTKYEYYIEEFSYGKFGKLYFISYKNNIFSTKEVIYSDFDIKYFNDAYYKYKRSLRDKKLKRLYEKNIINYIKNS